MKPLMYALTALGLLTAPIFAQESGFSRPTIDFGIVVTDVEASLKFYKEAIGFQDAGSFTVAPKIANDAGLTDASEELVIHKLKLGDGPGATTVKLMQIGEPKEQDQSFINSTAGISYITLFVTDTKAAIDRATENGAKVLAKGPVDLGDGTVFLTVVRDPDGNFVEFVGP